MAEHPSPELLRISTPLDEELNRKHSGWSMFRFRREKKSMSISSIQTYANVASFRIVMAGLSSPAQIFRITMHFPLPKTIPTYCWDKKQSLSEIHAACVLHRDIYVYNILVLLGDRHVMWVNFDESTCGSDTLWRTKPTLGKLALGWDFLYHSRVSPYISQLDSLNGADDIWTSLLESISTSAASSIRYLTIHLVNVQ